MDFIEEVLSKSYKSNKVGCLSSILALIFFYIFGVINFILFRDSGYVMIPMMLIGTIIPPILGYTLGEKLGKKLFKKRKISFESTKLYKKLEKNGYLDEFIETINEEIKSENAIKYSCDIMGVGLLVTKTWFVYITKVDPIIEKTEDIIKVSEELQESDFRHFLCVELKDKSYLRMDELELSDIEDEMKNKYPNIMIGYGIIEE